MSAIRRRIFPSVREGRDVICIEQTQDVEPIFKVNHETMMANGVGRTSLWQGREYVKIAEIPLVLIDQWHKQGLNFYDPNDWPVIRKLLNDSDWSKLRTAPGRI